MNQVRTTRRKKNCPMPLTRPRERHTCGAQHCCTVPDVSANSNICVLKFQPIKIIRVIQYQPIKTRVKETEKPDSYRRTTLGGLYLTYYHVIFTRAIAGNIFKNLFLVNERIFRAFPEGRIGVSVLVAIQGAI
jgi:hypothetical protein